MILKLKPHQGKEVGWCIMCDDRKATGARSVVCVDRRNIWYDSDSSNDVGTEEPFAGPIYGGGVTYRVPRNYLGSYEVESTVETKRNQKGKT